MAQKIQTLFIDDIDGSEAEGTVRFSFDGTDYEIDLSSAHADELRQGLAKYMSAGRKVSSTARRTTRSGARRTSTGEPNPSDVRDWAKSQGIEVKDRGRVPSELVVKFKAATGA